MSARQKVLDLLADDDMTSRDVAEALGINHNYVRVICSVLHTSGRIHVTKFCREEVNGRLYPRAVYRLGAGVDAKRPKPLSDAEYNRRYRQRTRGMINSVFALAGKVNDRRVSMDWRSVNSNKTTQSSRSFD